MPPADGDELRNLLTLYGQLADNAQTVLVDTGATCEKGKAVVAWVDELRPKLKRALGK